MTVVPAHFVIAERIIGMEGNGPRNLGRIVLADDPVAADFICTRLMGLNPRLVNYLAQSGRIPRQRDVRAHRALGRKAASRCAALRGPARVCSSASVGSAARNPNICPRLTLERKTGSPTSLEIDHRSDGGRPNPVGGSKFGISLAHRREITSLDPPRGQVASGG